MRTNPFQRRARRNPALLSAPAQASYDRLLELAPALYAAVDDAYWDEESRDGATKLLAGWLRDNGFKVLGYGGSRVVVKLDKRFAAKVAAFDDGVRQNENESGLWGIVSREAPILQDFLMPVHALDADEIVLLTEVAKPCTGRNRAACAAEITAAQKRLQGYPLTRGLSDAEYTFNWGFHNGSFKLLDYGI